MDMRMIDKVHVLDCQLPGLRYLSSYLKRSRTVMLQSFKTQKITAKRRTPRWEPERMDELRPVPTRLPAAAGRF